MCLSTVYILNDQGEKDPQPFAKNVSSLATRDGVITFTDLLGAEHSIAGTLTQVDFVGGTIVVQPA